MKLVAMIISLFVLGSFKGPSHSVSPLSVLNIECDSTPTLNEGVVEFVQDHIKKKVGRGECWDLAAQALNSIEAQWDGQYRYGDRVVPYKDCIYPGDIIQFKGVKVKYRADGSEYMEKMAHHTAIVYEVVDNGVYVIAHQNTYFSGKKVGLSTLDLKNVYKGKYYFYRPTK